jgi:hypothetical protein
MANVPGRRLGFNTSSEASIVVDLKCAGQRTWDKIHPALGPDPESLFVSPLFFLFYCLACINLHFVLRLSIMMSSNLDPRASVLLMANGFSLQTWSVVILRTPNRMGASLRAAVRCSQFAVNVPQHSAQ